jgi:hypothetical protein
MVDASTGFVAVVGVGVYGGIVIDDGGSSSMMMSRV